MNFTCKRKPLFWRRTTKASTGDIANRQACRSCCVSHKDCSALILAFRLQSKRPTQCSQNFEHFQPKLCNVPRFRIVEINTVRLLRSEESNSEKYNENKEENKIAKQKTEERLQITDSNGKMLAYLPGRSTHRLKFEADNRGQDKNVFQIKGSMLDILLFYCVFWFLFKILVSHITVGLPNRRIDFFSNPFT